MPRIDRRVRGFDQGGGPPHRLFFALWPDDALRDRIGRTAARLAQAHPGGGRLLRPDRYHLTLQFLGDIPADEHDDTLARSIAAAEAVRGGRFELVLDQAGGFPHARVWWLGTTEAPAGLRDLWNALDAGLKHAGQQVKPSPSPDFSPHLTIARDVRARLPPTPVEPLRWPVREFVLVDSQPPKPYKIVGRWPLHHVDQEQGE